MKLSQKLIKDITGTFATQIVVMLSALVINKLLSNFLSVDEFGQYNIIKRSSAVISFTILGGLGIAVPKFISAYNANTKTYKIAAFLRASILYFIISSILVVSILLFFGKDFKEYIIGSSSIFLIAIICVFSIANAFSTYVTVYYRGFNNFKVSNLNAILVGVLIVLPLLLLKPLSVELVYLSWAIVYALLSIIFFSWPNQSPLRTLKYIKVKSKEIESEFKLLSRYSFPRLFGDIFLFSFSAFPLIYIGAHENVTDVAYYSVGLTFVTLATPIFSFVGVILLPYVSSMRSSSKEDSDDSKKLVDNLAKIYALVSIIIICILGIGMPFFIRLFFSSEYSSVSGLARILIFAILPQAYYLLYRNPIDASKTFPYNTVIIGLSLLILILLFTWSNNLIQYAWSYVSVSCFQGLACFLIWNKIKNEKV